MYQSDSINNQFENPEYFSAQISHNQSNYYNYYPFYYGNYYYNSQYSEYYQSPQVYHGEYNFLNSSSYSYSSNNTYSSYTDNILSTSNLDSTGNSLNNSRYQNMSPNESKSSDANFHNDEKNSRKFHSRKQQLPEYAVEIMNDWFQDHLNNPYPTLEEKEKIAKQCGITVKQVTAWFSNRRNRSQNTKPKRIKRAIEQEMNQMINELCYNQDKTQIIEKFRRTFLNQ